ncbi:hypothetical protein [Pasteuria penetrans]|uniref:hypothetical protein n=1 Tax=Pasteuria penetrans TaxID=86005 RepID=UPI000FAFC666|nr:hypothetical protein [Pasteuria penetrans]
MRRLIFNLGVMSLASTISFAPNQGLAAPQAGGDHNSLAALGKSPGGSRSDSPIPAISASGSLGNVSGKGEAVSVSINGDKVSFTGDIGSEEIKVSLRFLMDGKSLCEDKHVVKRGSFRTELKECKLSLKSQQNKTLDAEVRFDGQVVAKGPVKVDSQGKVNHKFEARVARDSQDGSDQDGSRGRVESPLVSKKSSGSDPDEYKGRSVAASAKKYPGSTKLPVTGTDYRGDLMGGAALAALGTSALLVLYLVRRRRSAK